MKKIFSENKKKFIFIFLLTLIFYLPIILNPNVLLNRGNDLSEFFWPIINFVKIQIIEYKNFPFWTNLFLAGMPLLPDSQSPLFYLPNIIFLLLPLDLAYVVYIIIHGFFGGLGAFFCARYGFNLSPKIAFIAAAIFITSPKIAGYVEAGHLGLITSFNWLPYLLLSLIKISRFPDVGWMTLTAISLSQIFYTHIITFLISVVCSFFLLITNLILVKKFKRSLLYFFLSVVFTFGLISITLLPQLEWSTETTRFLLLKNPDIYPKWQSFEEFFISFIFPWANFKEYLNTDSEKWLSIGSSITIISLVGFFFAKTRLKIILIFVSFIVILISLNNISPIINWLNSQDIYKLMRVSTRVWFIEVLIIIFLLVWGLEVLLKKLPPRFHIIIYSLVFLISLENFILSWSRYSKTIQPEDFAPSQVYDFLQQDKNRFRVFCLNRCLSQKESSIRKIELIEGYNTLMQYNYYQQSWQFTNSFWNYYTLSIPPISLYAFENIQPDAKALGDYNVKYIISPYKIDNKDLVHREKFGKYTIYENKKLKPRAYFLENDRLTFNEAKIIHFSPNFIRVDTSSNNHKNVILAEVYNKQWTAYLNGKEKVNVQETPNRLRLVDITSQTKYVDFKYYPKSFVLGRFITLITIIMVILINTTLWTRIKRYFSP